MKECYYSFCRFLIENQTCIKDSLTCSNTSTTTQPKLSNTASTVTIVLAAVIFGGPIVIMVYWACVLAASSCLRSVWKKALPVVHVRVTDKIVIVANIVVLLAPLVLVLKLEDKDVPTMNDHQP